MYIYLSMNSEMMEEVIIHQELCEFQSLGDLFGETFFNRQRTLHLIEFYKRYKPLVGTGELKTMKKLWELVARDLSNLYRITISPAKCENKWKCLERNYKKVVDNNNQTGRGRKIFEYEKEFEDLYGKKCNIRPEILLSSDSVSIMTNASNNCEGVADENINPTEAITENVSETDAKISTPQLKRKRSHKSDTRTYKRRNEILLEMKNDLKNYYIEKTEIDKRKLALQERKITEQHKRTELLREYVDMVKEQGI